MVIPEHQDTVDPESQVGEVRRKFTMRLLHLVQLSPGPVWVPSESYAGVPIPADMVLCQDLVPDTRIDARRWMP
eukprot:1272904-Rhodomonas_salina.1